MFVALLALSVGQADAQRCLPKMKGIELKANMADGFHTSDKDNSAGYSFGAALSSYAKGGHKWVFGAEYLQWHSPYKDIRIPVSQFTAEGGYYYKFLSDARKIVFFYIGASALAGYETVNWGDKLLSNYFPNTPTPTPTVKLGQGLSLSCSGTVNPAVTRTE